MMRRAIETTGPVDMCLYSDDELRRVLETDMGALRRQAAAQELANRASRARHQL
ncbi:hypothetical protein [Parvibaculum lavamentivorans]|uniref:hypothetical protein n=1 Tax=Parvibaculum lavamentivorans TaxID=256618 RepID=UPI0014480A9F|nr:hypothetical protein [Parvibaculum lavamentivorans]